MVRQKPRDRSSSGADLLNFHFTTAPPPQQPRRSSANNQRRSNNQQHHHQNQQYRRNQNDRTSARRKPNAHMFSLHSSADHAFVITRHGMRDMAQQQSYSFTGCDQPVSWELVRLVKYLVPSSDDVTCPICLDHFLCARITKCGHCMCLPCLLRHVQVHTESNPYTHVKCPCCAVPLQVPDLRPVLFATSLPPRLHQRMTVVKLHRAKDCPTPYLPIPNAPKRSSSHAAPCVTDIDAPYCRFNYLDMDMYQHHLMSNKQELEGALEQLTKVPKNHYYQSDVEAIFISASLDVTAKELTKASEEMEQEQTLADSFANVGSGVYQVHSKHLMAQNYDVASGMTIATMNSSDSYDYNDNAQDQQRPQQQTVQREEGAELDQSCSQSQHDEGSECVALEGRYRGYSIGSEPSATQQQRHRGYSTGSVESHTLSSTHEGNAWPRSPNSQASDQRQQQRQKQPPQLPESSMYLEDEGSTHFYQCEDGQLCFLSRFNMSCLTDSFSSKVPDFDALEPPLASLKHWQQHQLLPLPDAVEGEILEIECVQLTPDLRKRLHFLSHLPLWMDIKFVELDINRILSADTQKKFKADFEKRRKRRQNKVKTEKREDKARQKEDEARINELKARMQQIDPNDEFFQVSVMPEPVSFTREDFGPSVSSGSIEQLRAASLPVADAPAFSFSSVCASGGAFPSLSAFHAPSNFPALGSSPPAKSGKPTANIIAGSWGSPSRNKAINAATTNAGAKQAQSPAPGWCDAAVNQYPPPITKQSPPVPTQKKKGKGKKIVLFSTGGQRGLS